MPSWYEDTQKKVASTATDILNTKTINPEDTVGQKAVTELGGTGPNAFTKSTSALTDIATGAANPWLSTGEPDTNTALGGLFNAQRDYFNQILPEVSAAPNAAAIGSGSFGSLRGQTAAQKARGDAYTKLAQDQMNAALQNQATGVNAAKAAGDVESSYIKNLQDTAGWEMSSPFTNISNYSKVVGGIQAPTTVENTTKYSPLSLIGGLANVLGGTGGTGGLMNQLFGSGGKGGLFNAIKAQFSGPNAEGVADITPKDLQEGDPGFGWKYYSDGTAVSPDGVYYFQGNQVYDPLDQYTNTDTGWDTYNAWDQAGPDESVLTDTNP